jgi:hypothetical protein
MAEMARCYDADEALELAQGALQCIKAALAWEVR